MTPRPLTSGDRVMILDGTLPSGWIAAIVDDRCTVMLAATGRHRVVFCDQVVALAPALLPTLRLHEGQP